MWRFFATIMHHFVSICHKISVEYAEEKMFKKIQAGVKKKNNKTKKTLHHVDLNPYYCRLNEVQGSPLKNHHFFFILFSWNSCSWPAALSLFSLWFPPPQRTPTPRPPSSRFSSPQLLLSITYLPPLRAGEEINHRSLDSPCGSSHPGRGGFPSSTGAALVNAFGQRLRGGSVASVWVIVSSLCFKEGGLRNQKNIFHAAFFFPQVFFFFLTYFYFLPRFVSSIAWQQNKTTVAPVII